LETCFTAFSTPQLQKLPLDLVKRYLLEVPWCLTDERGCFLECSDSYLAAYGYSRQQLIGQNFTLLLPEEQRPAAQAMHDRFIAGAAEMPSTWEVLDAKGQPFRIRINAIHCHTESGIVNKLTILELVERTGFAAPRLEDFAQHP
jgi:PAS domain S-box-containing protein